MKSIQLHKVNSLQGEVLLPTSKSESNRALIIQALARLQAMPANILLQNISEARDTQTLQRLLLSNDEVLDVLDAGTTMRFLTAFCTATNRQVILTGTPRMQQRPIGILVEALTQLGANIQYQQEVGFPPIKIVDFQQKEKQVSLQGNVSSQYVSALLLIAPFLPDGLTVTLLGKVTSRPYIQMTLTLLRYFGINYTWEDNIIEIAPQPYRAATYAIEADWSGASYWYSWVALAEEGTITLLGLRENSLQGDKAIVDIGEKLGVKTIFTENGVQLSKIPHQTNIQVDFTHCPDLAQTVAVCCAAKDIALEMTGLESLRIKETDRIKALQQELAKFGYTIREEAQQTPTHWYLEKIATAHEEPTVETYEDHRMAMAFAPLATQQTITILAPEVVVKSYPNYWSDIHQVGVSTEENH